MGLSSELNKTLTVKKIKRSKHCFPLKDFTFRNKDLIEGIKVIFSKNVTMSKVTKKFEKIFSKKIKTPYSLMVNSGSSANFLAFQCLINPYRKKRLKKGDEVLIPSISLMAPTLYSVMPAFPTMARPGSTNKVGKGMFL